MKVGIRKPSLKKSISARTTGKVKRKLKRITNPLYGKKGMGFIKNPVKSIKGKIYRKTTVSAKSATKGLGGCLWGLCLLTFYMIWYTLVIMWYILKYTILGMVWLFVLIVNGVIALVEWCVNLKKNKEIEIDSGNSEEYEAGADTIQEVIEDDAEEESEIDDTEDLTTHSEDDI